MRKFLSILLVLFSFVAVEAQPIGECSVDFTASVDGLELYLYGTASLEDSTETVTWSWDLGALGDAVSGDLNSPAIVAIALPGVYTICATITTSTGCSATSCQDIVVEQDGLGGGDSTDCFLWASFFMTTSGTTATFNDISFNGNDVGGINSWAWDFGDDNTSTDQNPIHTYTEEGLYVVCLTVTNDDGCTSTSCQDVVVGDVAIDCTTITNGTSPYAADDSIFLQVIAQDSFCCTGNWDGVCQSLYDDLAGGGNGGIDTLDCASILNGSSPYGSDDPIFLEVIEEDSFCCTGSWDGLCQDLYDELAGNGNGGGDSLCVAMFYHTAMDSTAAGNDFPGGLTVTFWDGSWGAGDWSWDLGDGNTAMGPQIIHTYDMAGTYTVCLTIVNQEGCTAVYCEDIVVSGEAFCYSEFFYTPSEDDDLTLTFEDWSSFDVAAWAWDFGDDNTSTEANPTHSFSSYGEYEVCLTTVAVDGCTSTVCHLVILYDPADCLAHFWHSALPADSIELDSIIIDPGFGGLTVTLFDCSLGNPDSWTWDFGDGNTGTGPQLDHTYAEEGTYTICLTISNEAGCDDTTCQDIYVAEGDGWNQCYAQFEAYATDATATSAGYNYVFENWSPDNTIASTWDFGDGATSDEQSPTYTYTEDGIYTVCLTIVTTDQCVNTMCYDILVGATGWGPTGLTLCGSVNVANNFNEPTAYDATVYLIEYDADNNTLTAVDSTIAIGFGWGQDDSSSFSFYCFDGLEEGSQYLVKAAMNEWSPLYEDYLPTYYDGVLSWMDATTVTVDDDLFGIDINMVAGDNPGGPGFIGGNVADGAGKSLSELEGIMVMLLDANGNPIGFTHTDEEGNYSFDNIAYGTYTVHIEIINIPSEPVTVTISQDIPMVEDANFIKTSEQVSADFSSSIEDLILVGINGFNVAPNPIQSQTVIGFNAERAMEAELGIFNVMGQRVHQESLNIEAGSNAFEVDASNLAKGIYLIQLSQNGQAVHQVKVVKQ